MKGQYIKWVHASPWWLAGKKKKEYKMKKKIIKCNDHLRINKTILVCPETPSVLNLQFQKTINYIIMGL